MLDIPQSKIDWKVESQRFDAVADLYKAYRPGYPPELIDDLINQSGLQTQDSILEIGCGPGTATLQFAKRGYYPLCLDPGQNLLDTAQKRLNTFPDIQFVQARYEDWRPQQTTFNLIYSAQAFHWVPKEIRYQKTANMLAPNGWLGIFWNMYPGGTGRLWEALDDLYQRMVPEIASPRSNVSNRISEIVTEMNASDRFAKSIVKEYPWTTRYTAEAYVGLLNTYSDHLRLEASRRDPFFRAVVKLINSHGGFIDRAYHAVLFMGQKRVNV